METCRCGVQTSFFKPANHVLSWGEKRRAGRRQQSLLRVFCPGELLPAYIHFQKGMSLKKNNKKKYKRRQIIATCTGLEILGFRNSQGESDVRFDLGEVLFSRRKDILGKIELPPWGIFQGRLGLGLSRTGLLSVIPY